jgi:histone H3/H4
MIAAATFFRRCSNCKKEIALGAKYFICSVSTCQRQRAPIQFCSPDCFEVHNEVERHKDGWAVEQKAPLVAEPESPAPASAPKSATPKAPAHPTAFTPSVITRTVTTRNQENTMSEDETLIVVSRVKDHIKQSSGGMNTSEQIVSVLTDNVRKLADEGIENAKKANRKTVMGRDIPRPAASGDGDTLVVVSRLKSYISTKGDMRTSDEVLPVISDEIRRLCAAAVEAAKKDGRKTVMGRDFPGGAATA